MLVNHTTNKIQRFTIVFLTKTDTNIIIDNINVIIISFIVQYIQFIIDRILYIMNGSKSLTINLFG